MNDKKLIIEFAEKIVQRGLSVPAIFLLESTKYISFIAGQTLIFFGPILTIFIKDNKYYDFIDLIEKKENIEMLIDQIEKNNASLNK